MSEKPYRVVGISLPHNTWDDIDTQAQEWGTSGRSAAVLRIVEEWKALRKALAATKGENTDSKIIVIAA